MKLKKKLFNTLFDLKYYFNYLPARANRNIFSLLVRTEKQMTSMLYFMVRIYKKKSTTSQIP